MGVTERKIREKEQRRQVIIAAAEKLFAENSVDATSMAQIAKSAELAKGTLYLYFETKDDLCMAITARALEQLGTYFRGVDQDMSGIDQIEEMGKAYFTFVHEHPFYAYMMNVADNVDLKMDEMPTENTLSCMAQGAGTMQLFIDTIQNGVNDGTIRADGDPTKTAFLLWSFSTGLINTINKRGGAIELQYEVKITELTEYFYSFVRAALRV